MTKVSGNLQRIRNGERRYAITPRLPGGFIHADLLQKFVDVARTFHGVLKVTGGQRIMITNLKAEDVDKAWEMLGMMPTVSGVNSVRTVKICPGTTFCKRAKQDSVKLGMQLEQKYMSKEMPSKMKIGVSGCPNSCSESIVKDVGIIGTVDGWEIYAGGTAGAHPRMADFIVFVATEKEVVEIVDRLILFYKENAHIERMGEFIDRIGLENFKKAVLGETYEVDISMDEAQIISSVPTESSAELQLGDAITADSIIRHIIDVYPATIPVLQDIGMGCLGCPSATAEPLWQAAAIHGVDIKELVEKLQAARGI